MDVRDLTDYGYVVAVADLRGKGASFGTRRGMADSTEGKDGYDITEWLASQSW
jgi:predicted acyl esterase